MLTIANSKNLSTEYRALQSKINRCWDLAANGYTPYNIIYLNPSIYSYGDKIREARLLLLRKKAKKLINN